MAYVDQILKKRIQGNLKALLPENWKWSLKVQNHSALSLTIWEAPEDLRHIMCANSEYGNACSTAVGANHFGKQFASARLDTVSRFKRIFEVMNEGNHDHSDYQTDYFDIGWYVNVHVGSYDHPFKYVPVVDDKVMDGMINDAARLRALDYALACKVDQCRFDSDGALN